MQSVQINDTKLEFKDGKYFLNGREIQNNIVTRTKSIAPHLILTFIIGLAVGFECKTYFF